MTAYYVSTPQGQLHLTDAGSDDSHTYCGEIIGIDWLAGTETVVGSRACGICYRGFKAAQGKQGTIDRAHEGRS
jgi:hypothetical protein